MVVVSPRSPLTLGQAAAELGVHYQTAYRWVRQVMSPRSNATACTRSNPRPSPSCTAPSDSCAGSGGPPGALLEPARRPSLQPDARRRRDEAREAVDELVAAGVGLAELCDSLLAPVMRRIGDDWSSGELGVAVKHAPRRSAAGCSDAGLRRRRDAPVASPSCVPLPVRSTAFLG